MTITAWNQELQTGIKELDAQHQELLTKANLILVESKILPAEQVCKQAIEYLIPALDAHFKTEEAHMSQCGYPGFRTHQASHSEMTMKVRHLNILIQDNPNPVAELQEILKFMNTAILKHMFQDDMEFVQYYKAAQKNQENK